MRALDATEPMELKHILTLIPFELHKVCLAKWLLFRFIDDRVTIELMDQAEQNDVPEEALKLYSNAVEELRNSGLVPQAKSQFEEWELAKEGEDAEIAALKVEGDNSKEHQAPSTTTPTKAKKEEKEKLVLTAEEKLGELLKNALGGRASVYGHLEDFEKALADLTEALQYDYYHIETLIRRGEIHLRMENHKEAAKDFNRVREVQPDQVDAVYYLSLMIHAHFKKNY